MIEVYDENGKTITAYQVLVKHEDHFGKVSDQDPSRYEFAVSESGKLSILSNGGVFIFSIPLTAFPQYEFVLLTE